MNPPELQQPVASSDGFRWVESSGLPSRIIVTLLFLIVYAIVIVGLLTWAVGLSVLAQAIELSPAGGAWSETVVFYVMFLGAPLAVLAVTLWIGTVRVGIGDDGIRVVTRLRTSNVAWSSIRPGMGLPKGDWCALRYGMTQRTGPSIVWITKDQARAILTHPKSPSGLFPPEYWSWLGLRAPETYHLA
jgi:hypothetical protein